MMMQNPKSDPVIDEIHLARREFSDRFGGDFDAMLDDARRRQEASGRPIWRPTHDQQTLATESAVGTMSATTPDVPAG